MKDLSPVLHVYEQLQDCIECTKNVLCLASKVLFRVIVLFLNKIGRARRGR